MRVVGDVNQLCDRTPGAQLARIAKRVNERITKVVRDGSTDLSIWKREFINRAGKKMRKRKEITANEGRSARSADQVLGE